MAEQSIAAVRDFLRARHDVEVNHLEPLTGGFWSSAFSYSVDGRELVLRLGSMREGYEADRAAMAYSSSELPVPSLLEIGDAFGESYAISERHHGSFLEDVDPAQAGVVAGTLTRLLVALRAVPDSSPAQGPSWRGWLLDGLVDDPSRRVSGWRKELAADPALDRLFAACESRITSLLDACPERRDLVHGDLLHQNVLIAPDATRVTAVFSWKCSVRGDFLFDTAWCTFWGASFHPGIAAADPWHGITTYPSVVADSGALVDAAERHHCYELQIGATHLGWNTWVGNHAHRRRVAQHLDRLLEQGPRTLLG